MLLKNLSKVYVCKAEERKDHGEVRKTWKFVSTAFLNLQQDISLLDRNTAGVIDYSIINARTTKSYNIQKGNGISLTDISKLSNLIPDYVVTDSPKIGHTTLYKLEKYNGE